MRARLRLDLHLHTRASPDSSIEIASTLAAVRKAGLDGFAVTDHNTMEAVPHIDRLLADDARRSRESGSSPLVFIPGVEVSTREGHLLAYFVPRPPERGLSLRETIDRVHEMGGIAALAHPFRRAHGAGRSLGAHPTLHLDIVETMNGHNAFSTNQKAEGLARSLGLPTTGGSDAHAVGEVGRCYTEVVAGDISPGRSLLSYPLKAGGESLTLGGGVRVWIGNARKRAARGLKPL